MADLTNIRTLQDVINALNIVYFNMNEIERIYYDMFINPDPMDLTFQRYDDQGVLENITLPNRAKDRQDLLTGNGSPEAVVQASVGTYYLDTLGQNLYFKGSGSDAYGWVEIYTTLNLKVDEDFLAPDGDGSRLTNLNASNINSGLLTVGRGGTGSSGIIGLVKGNGTSAYTAALEGTDYVGPNTMTGVIAYYPVKNIPSGWLMCDGTAYSRSTYERLFNIIGTIYGEGDGSTTFNVPDLMDDGNGNSFFIRCWDGDDDHFNHVQQDQAGVHTHGLSLSTQEESQHTHDKGSMNITGSFASNANNYSASGAFAQASGRIGAVTETQWSTGGFTFDASRSWTGVTGAGTAHSHVISGNTQQNTAAEEGTTETRVLNKMLVPVIKF